MIKLHENMATRRISTPFGRRRRETKDKIDYLRALRNEIIQIAKVDGRTAVKLIQNSDVYRYLRRPGTTVLQEHPAYYAFLLTYNGDDWYERYLDYLREQAPGRKKTTR